ncbi:helix-turn-helix domain-containing protein [Paenibacillus sacheonensis]|uniref:Helix-turn-helix domain-containing protein n=1 Tax=Paenibacillus sacheonensis TaxID=742054 RepID=A0A7X4YW23_9BACL|nr:helix-turn-helix domain-containing protein [Paenibacillus sacheonensis]MBM7568976.1 DNA-binding Xre family transcriptional regulator/PAS domain-containing protein [Paenibacillus sacheonensis]NBC72651.1 helix-turn-helix domain-containing protein [Paenibacillus sacheonensis]
MTLSTVVFQNLKTPLAVVVVGQDDDCRFNLANKAFSRLVGFSGDMLEGLPPDRLFSEWDRSTLLSLHQHETSLLKHLAGDDPLRLRLTCEALGDAGDAAFLLTVEDISAKCWIDRMSETREVLISGILNDRFIIERYFKYYPAPVFDPLFPVEAFINDYVQEDERERIFSRLRQTVQNRSTDQIVVRTKDLTGTGQLEVHVTYRPFYHGDGSLKNIAFVVSHIQPAVGPGSAPVDSSVTLKVLMARRYMSAQQLSSETGISMQTISKLRNGKINRPQRQTALLIANALQVSPQDIWP